MSWADSVSAHLTLLSLLFFFTSLADKPGPRAGSPLFTDSLVPLVKGMWIWCGHAQIRCGLCACVQACVGRCVCVCSPSVRPRVRTALQQRGRGNDGLPVHRGSLAAGPGDSKVKVVSLAWSPRRRCLARHRVRARSAWLECGGTTGTKRWHTWCMAWMSAGERAWTGSTRGRVYGEASRLAWKRDMRHRRRHGEAAKARLKDHARSKTTLTHVQGMEN